MLYNVPEVTLHTKMNGATPIAERRPANQLLTEIEDEVIVEYILNLDSRGYPPLIGNVEERRKAMALPLHPTTRRAQDAFISRL